MRKDRKRTKPKKVEYVPPEKAEKKEQVATVSLETAEAMSQPVGDCYHPGRGLFLLDEDTDEPFIVCTGCASKWPVVMLEEGQEPSSVWITPKGPLPGQDEEE